MKVLIPAAGLGTRLRPHTHHRPKPLIPVAGKNVLGHVLDKLVALDIDELIFIVGHLGNQIRDYVESNYDYATSFVRQDELKGQAHAISLARDQIDGPLLILFVDTIFEADLAGLRFVEGDGVIFYKEVADPRRFGIITVDDAGHIDSFVEKPSDPRSNRAVIGLYYVQDGPRLIAAIDELIARDIQTKGEFYLADALQLMIDDGAKFKAWPVEVWEDCGTVPAVLQTNRYLLAKLEGVTGTPAEESGAVLIPPLHIEPGAVIHESVVGPHVHVGANCHISRSVVGPNVSLGSGSRVVASHLFDAIVDLEAQIDESALMSSLVGERARVRGNFDRLNVGDSSEIDSRGEGGDDLLGAPKASE